MTLYEVLGLDPSASADALHRAYRERARQLHPDRRAQGTDDERRTAEASMQELNAAWAVLSDPARRREYDRSLVPPPPVAPPRPEAPTYDELDDTGYGGDGLAMLVRVLPVVLVLAVLAAIFVFTAFANNPPDDQGPSNTPAGASIGDCVVLRGGQVSEIVACGVPNDGRVAHLINRTDACPPGERRADGRDGSSALCLL